MNKASLLRCGLAAIVSLSITSTALRTHAACTLTPMRSTNSVNGQHTVTALVTGTNGAPVAGVEIEFEITSGPNAPIPQISNTDASGQTAFTYTSNGSEGRDVIRARGTLNGDAFSCTSTQFWIVPGAAATISCPANIVTNTGPAGCSRQVAFSVTSSGTPMPTIRCRAGEDPISNMNHQFAVGTTTVTCVASNVNGTAECSFTVTVNETELPNINCGQDVFATAAPGSGGTEVTFDLPGANDNCGDPVVVCEPASGTFFGTGTTPVTCTASDNAANKNTCTFNVTVEEAAPDAHDLAVVRIRAPRVVKLKNGVATKRVVVTIQNRSAHTETFSDPSQLANLVSLAVTSYDPNTCPDVTPFLLERPPQRRLPFNLRPRQKLNVYFEVTFDCAVNPARGAGAEDFYYTAQVYHEAIDGIPDSHPECDVCPRPPLEGGFDPNPNGRIRDRGCGAPVGRGFFGNDVITDVVIQ